MSDGCRDVRPHLDELADGTLDEARARAARAHLRACPRCAGELDEITATTAAAAELPHVHPPSGQWRAIAARLDVEDRAAARRPRLWWWWHAWRKHVLAGAGVTALAGAASVYIFARSQQPLEAALRALPRPAPTADELYEAALRDVARAGDDYASAIRELREIVALEKPHWRPEVARAFDENLAAIDAAIERQAEIARGTPGDPQLADALHASYRRQIDFMQEAVVRGQLQ